MEGLYQQTNRLIVDIQSQLHRLGTASRDAVTEIEKQIDSKLEEVSANCNRLNILVNKEPPHKRQSSKINNSEEISTLSSMNKLKVDQLFYDLRHLQSAFHNYQQRKILREQEEQERDELLNTRFTTNNSGETSILIDHALQHNTGLQNASHEVDHLIDSGSSILSGLRDQHSMLKGAKKRMLDIASTLGLSNTVMRLIDKRATQDKWILLGGMVVTCVIMFLVVKYLT